MPWSLLGEPRVEGDRAELGVRAGDQRPLAQPYPGGAGLLAGADLPGVTLGREPLAHQLVEAELLRAADLADPVQWRPHRDASHARGNVVGRDRLEQRRRQTHLAVDGAQVRDGFDELEELRGVHD